MASTVKLTKSKVEQIEVPRGRTALYWDSELPGFGLRITPKGTRSYIAQGRVNAHTRRITLGRHGILTADEARKRARKTLGQLADGIDPRAERERQRAASVTLREVVDDYLENRRRKDGKPLADRTKDDIRRHLKKNFTEWADKPVVTITRDAVRRKYISLGQRSHAQANQAKRNLSALLNYASATYRSSDGQPLLSHNPVDVIRDSNIHFADNARDNRVPKDKVGHFVSVLEQTRISPTSSPSVRTKAFAALVLLVTGLRKADLLQRTWDDADLTRGTLHLVDTKHREPRTFPLPCQVVSIIRDQQKIATGPYIFQSDGGNGPVHNLTAGLKPANASIEHHVATHDLRRTFDDIFDHLGIDPIIGELLSNRKPAGSSVRFKHYADTKDLTRYMKQAQQIADYCFDLKLAYESDTTTATTTEDQR